MADDFGLNFIRRGQASSRKPPEEELPKIPENLREQAARSTVRIPRSESGRIPPRVSLANAHHLQIARAANRRPLGQAGTSPQGFQGVSPVQRSIGKAKAIVMASKLGGHDLGDLQEKMESIRDDPNVSLSEFEHTLDTVIQNERNKPPEAAKPPGSVTISRGNGPNAISQEQLQAGANRNIAALPEGENFSEKANSYTVGGIRPPANPSLPPDLSVKPIKSETETPYQRAEGAELERRVNAAEAEEKKADKVDTSTDDAAIRAAEENPEAQEAAFRNNSDFGQTKVGAGEFAKVEAETNAAKARANLQEHNLGLPGAPGIPQHPATGLPIITNPDHHAALPPGTPYHAPDGQMYIKSPLGVTAVVNGPPQD